MALDITKLIRRRDPDHEDCWLVYCDDIHARTIARAAGTPNALVQWKWSAVYPGSRPGEIETGTADTFEEPRRIRKSVAGFRLNSHRGGLSGMA
jgi:hypothetical protein